MTRIPACDFARYRPELAQACQKIIDIASTWKPPWPGKVSRCEIEVDPTGWEPTFFVTITVAFAGFGPNRWLSFIDAHGAHALRDGMFDIKAMLHQIWSRRMFDAMQKEAEKE